MSEVRIFLGAPQPYREALAELARGQKAKRGTTSRVAPRSFVFGLSSAPPPGAEPCREVLTVRPYGPTVAFGLAQLAVFALIMSG